MKNIISWKFLSKFPLSGPSAWTAAVPGFLMSGSFFQSVLACMFPPEESLLSTSSKQISLPPPASFHPIILFCLLHSPACLKHFVHYLLAYYHWAPGCGLQEEGTLPVLFTTVAQHLEQCLAHSSPLYISAEWTNECTKELNNLSHQEHLLPTCTQSWNLRFSFQFLSF